jgi:hypothetical protein
MNRSAMHLNRRAPYFNMTIPTCRTAGSRGGRMSVRNRRQRQAGQPTVGSAAVPQDETVHGANELLDAQFPTGASASQR